MNLRSQKLDYLLTKNRRRRNGAALRQKAINFGIHATLGTEEDSDWLDLLTGQKSIENDEQIEWNGIFKHLQKLLVNESGSLIFAPYDKEEFGVLRVGVDALVSTLHKPPSNFDLDGFWLAGSFGAVLVDIDETGLDIGNNEITEFWWTRYPYVEREKC